MPALAMRPFTTRGAQVDAIRCDGSGLAAEDSFETPLIRPISRVPPDVFALTGPSSRRSSIAPGRWRRDVVIRGNVIGTARQLVAIPGNHVCWGPTFRDGHVIAVGRT